MNFFFLANRCLVLLFVLTVVSSMSNNLCQKLRKQQEKIRVLGEAFGGTLFIITASGHLFKLKLSSTLRKDSTEGHYYLKIGGEPTSHVSERWPNVPLDLNENKNKLYALQFEQNSRKAILYSLFKTETGNWLNSLYSGECRPLLEIGHDQSATKSTVDHFELCNSKTLNDNEDAFMMSRSPLYSSKNPITFVKSKIDNRYHCDGVNVNCLNIDYFVSNDTVLAASHLAEPYNILLFIYTSGYVEIRQVPTFPTTGAPSPNWTVPIRDFIQCEATQQEESTTTATTDDVSGLWHTHTWRIVIVAFLLVLNGICLVLLYRKRYKKKKQAPGKWIASFLWAKKRNKKRNDKKKPKDTKKNNEKK